MPVYEYVCKACMKDFTVFLSLKEFETNPKIRCTHCQSNNITKKLGSFFTKTSKKS